MNLRSICKATAWFTLAVCLLPACGSSGSEQETADSATELPDAQRIQLLSYQHLPVHDSLYGRLRQTQGYGVEAQQLPAAELLNGLQNDPPPDVVVFPHVGMAGKARRAGLLQFHGLPGLDSYYKSRLRDDDGYWTGLSRRYPVIAFRKDAEGAGQLRSFPDLADPKWKGQLILPPASSPILQGVVASIYVQRGKATAARWVQQVLANRTPELVPGSRERLLALSEGKGQLTIAMLDDFAKLRNPATHAELRASEQLEVVMPKDAEGQTHYTVSCAVVPKGADPRKAAVLVEFLCSQYVQETYPAAAYEYPANVMALPAEFLINYMGGIKDDEMSLEVLAQYMPVARKLMLEEGWPE